MRTLLSAIMLVGLICTAPAWSAEEQIVFTQSANGSRTTRPFTVADGWEVRWKADRSISIFTVARNGEAIAEIGSASAPGSGSTYQAKGGTFSLQIISGANWTITVVQLP